jgi:heme oxygenase
LNDEDAVLLLVRARWNEHMVENVILANDGHVSEEGYQDMLMRQKLARAKLEAEIYALAIEKKQRELEAVASESTRFRTRSR